MPCPPLDASKSVGKYVQPAVEIPKITLTTVKPVHTASIKVSPAADPKPAGKSARLQSISKERSSSPLSRVDVGRKASKPLKTITSRVVKTPKTRDGAKRKSKDSKKRDASVSISLSSSHDDSSISQSPKQPFTKDRSEQIDELHKLSHSVHHPKPKDDFCRVNLQKLLVRSTTELCDHPNAAVCREALMKEIIMKAFESNSNAIIDMYGKASRFIAYCNAIFKAFRNKNALCSNSIIKKGNPITVYSHSPWIVPHDIAQGYDGKSFDPSMVDPSRAVMAYIDVYALTPAQILKEMNDFNISKAYLLIQAHQIGSAGTVFGGEGVWKETPEGILQWSNVNAQVWPPTPRSKFLSSSSFSTQTHTIAWTVHRSLSDYVLFKIVRVDGNYPDKYPCQIIGTRAPFQRVKLPESWSHWAWSKVKRFSGLGYVGLLSVQDEYHIICEPAAIKVAASMGLKTRNSAQIQQVISAVNSYMVENKYEVVCSRLSLPFDDIVTQTAVYALYSGVGLETGLIQTAISGVRDQLVQLNAHREQGFVNVNEISFKKIPVRKVVGVSLLALCCFIFKRKYRSVFPGFATANPKELFNAIRRRTQILVPESPELKKVLDTGLGRPGYLRKVLHEESLRPLRNMLGYVILGAPLIEEIIKTLFPPLGATLITSIEAAQAFIMGAYGMAAWKIFFHYILLNPQGLIPSFYIRYIIHLVYNIMVLYLTYEQGFFMPAIAGSALTLLRKYLSGKNIAIALLIGSIIAAIYQAFNPPSQSNDKEVVEPKGKWYDNYKDCNVIVDPIPHTEILPFGSIVRPKMDFPNKFNFPEWSDIVKARKIGYFIIFQTNAFMYRPAGPQACSYALERRNIIKCFSCDCPYDHKGLCPQAARWAHIRQIFERRLRNTLADRLTMPDLSEDDWIKHMDTRAKRRRATFACLELHQSVIPKLSSEVFVKSNEILPAKDLINMDLHIKPRTINNVSSTLQAYAFNSMKQALYLLRNKFKNGFNIPNLAIEGETMSISIVICSGLQSSDIADAFWDAKEFCEVMIEEGNTRAAILVSGDDSLIFMQDPSGTKYYEFDVSKCDRSQSIHAFESEYDVLNCMGVSPDVIKALRALHKVPTYYYDRINNQRIKVEMPIQRHTGGPDTTLGNNLVVTMTLVDAISRGLNKYDEHFKKLGFEMTGGPVSMKQATFLKGWFDLEEETDRPYWLPLPSQVLKIGKSMRDPRELFKDSKDPLGAFCYSISRSLQHVPRRYPVLGALLKVFDQFAKGNETDVELPELAGRFWKVKVEHVHKIDVIKWMDRMSIRYNVSYEVIQDCDSRIRAIKELPIYFEHPFFAAMLRKDYL
jgi:hypothetical protein